MAVRNSAYARQAGDLYVTPYWVWQSLFKVEPWAAGAWDCCPENPKHDFLECQFTLWDIATNPPYGRQAEKIIRHAIALTEIMQGRVAMLLPHAYDCAKGRVDLFDRHPFKRKWTLTSRIRWANLKQKDAGPSSNHAWFIWDWKFIGPPKMGWIGGKE